MSPQSAIEAPVTHRFYRPELDVLRFFAFLAVLIHHGPYAPGVPNLFRRMGGFGLSMFFLLSSFLITELLVREREQTKTVNWKAFFVRRALRIWPLYFAALMAGILIGQVFPHSFRISGRAIAGMAFFIVNWGSLYTEMGALLGVLWSISIEEQFYLIWAPVLKFGGTKLAFRMAVVFVVLAFLWIPVFSAQGWRLWYDTPVQFLFFGAGVFIALRTHRQPLRISAPSRWLLAMAGLVLLAFAGMNVGSDFVPPVPVWKLIFGYGAAVAGCTAIFLANFGVTETPRSLIYLGKISFGLYVFHPGFMLLSEWLLGAAKLRPVVNLVVVDGLALCFCVAAAHLSYQYFEKPFLKLKNRFEIIQSRPA